MFKQTLVIASLLSLLVAGCSTDQRYKREVEGNENYLQSSELKPLIVPNGVRVPTESADYHVFKAAREGEVGKNLDIRPPVLPLPTIADSYATYENGMIKLDSPEYSGFWSQIPAILSANNIATERSDKSAIKTGVRLVNRSDEEQPVEATYLLQRRVASGREYITIELTSLKRMGQDISGTTESQYYTAEFFNLLMNQVSSSSSQVNN
ncbi:hypothetical protein GCM10023211_05200 [Orbus sasakiae]|uniref:Outer membrane protein assembly factor BamC n=1 Tax=Orbus sasakiae TaxID=1078475 RepID=A0ABP9N0W8_9GAMM